jgi:predicted ATP-dependent Lon-type protease
MSFVSAISTVPGELLAKLQTAFYQDPVDAMVKALGMD